MENIIVVDSECVYTKIDEILGEKFNTTTQICCKGSGVHDKYQLGQEVECCGGKKFQLKSTFIHISAEDDFLYNDMPSFFLIIYPNEQWPLKQ